MSSVASQAHGKFKVFIGSVGSQLALTELVREVEAFVRNHPCAPKSIAVEYLESSKKLMLSLGYRDDEPPYAITLSTIPIGRIGDLEAEDVARLEARFAEVAGAIRNVIASEIFVNGTECTMVLMSPGAG